MSGRFAGHDQLVDFDKAKANGFRFLFGVDEAGRGPLAGPVVASAVLVPDMDFSSRISDSKELSEAQREKAFAEIHEKAVIGVGIVDEKTIDEINILKASHLAMTIAVKDLSARMTAGRQEVLVLVDGNSYQGDIPYKVECVVKGDSKSFAIACASIIAKVTRDRIMAAYDKTYPQYGFSKHKGYGTEFHYAAIKAHGLLGIHRKTFRTG